MKNKYGNIVIGIILVIIGIGFVGNVFEVWHFNIFFPGWWTLFIIVPAAVNIANKGPKVGYIIWLAIGVLMLVGRLGIIGKMLSALFIPAVILLIGFLLIFRVKLGGKTSNSSELHIDNHIAIFSGQEPNYSGRRFEGAYVTAIFGGVDLMLQNAAITDGAAIDAMSIFGGVDIKLPHDVNIEMHSIPLFGGVSVAKDRVYSEAYPTIKVNAVCIFGGVDIT
ncbi:MAG: cell wall-active antibiotics response protein [Clostridiales bacterium]|nr:cell wall-active antibiotics response protein [Clostridiales bacterium]